MADFIEFDFNDDIEFDLDSLLYDGAGAGAGAGAVASPEPWVSDVARSENSDSPSKVPDVWPPENSDSALSWMSEIERILLDEEADTGGKGIGEDFPESCNFFSGLIAGVSEGAERDPAAPDADAPSENEKRDALVLEDAEDEDTNSKKRRRQMRNRYSAMKSRERKNSYQKDLEMKSKYLESECRRLNYALRCYEAENMALRQHLQKERPFGAPLAKQESAVLFMESLLLGSLFWLVSIVCLFLMPSLLIPNPKDASRLGRGLAREVVGAERLATKRVGTEIKLDLVIMRRRYRGTRTRMKLCLFPLHAVSA